MRPSGNKTTSTACAFAQLTSASGRVGDWRGAALAARFQSPPVKPGMRFSRTRLTDVLHRRCSAFPRQSRKGLGGMTVLCKLARPR
jgi:hypothetical protein